VRGRGRALRRRPTRDEAADVRRDGTGTELRHLGRRRGAGRGAGRGREAGAGLLARRFGRDDRERDRSGGAVDGRDRPRRARGEAGPPPVRDEGRPAVLVPLPPGPPMTILDYAVVGLYALGMLAVGRYYARRVRTADDYLLGGRAMSPLMIGLSLFATLTSTLTYLALPGEMAKNGPIVFAELLALPFAYLIVGWVLIPRIMRERVTSGYELLEARLGLTGRLLGESMFVVLRVFWMASILYATASVVLVPLLDLDPRWMPALSVAMMAVTLAYTAEGGL